MTPGETVKVLIDYDLYELNVKNLNGVFIKILANQKCLIYFEQNGEWAEIQEKDLKRVKKSHVPKKNKAFLARVKQMQYTI